MITVLKVLVVFVYLFIGITSGINVAFRLGVKRKQDKKEFLLFILTLPLSLIISVLSYLTVRAMIEKAIYENVKLDNLKEKIFNTQSAL